MMGADYNNGCLLPFSSPSMGECNMTMKKTKAAATPRTPASSNAGFHQMKFDNDAYRKLTHEREHLQSLGRHPSFSDALRELYNDAHAYRKHILK